VERNPMNPRKRVPRWLRPGWLLVGLGSAGLAWYAVARGQRAEPEAGAVPPAAEAPAEAPVTLPPAGDTTARPPGGVRVKVQVVNATRVRGLARRATQYLRERGWDVVEVGTTREQRDATLVLDRSGHPEWARRVAHAMGGAAIEARPDTSRYLDVTVLVGRTWRPPAEPFHP
jgi:hypothetical protein